MDTEAPGTEVAQAPKFLAGAQKVTRIAWAALYAAWTTDPIKGPSISIKQADRIQAWFEEAMLPARARNPMTGEVIDLDETGAGYEDFRFADGLMISIDQSDATVLRKRFDTFVEKGYTPKLARGISQSDALILNWTKATGSEAKPA